jgi:hypothetical protein
MASACSESHESHVSGEPQGNIRETLGSFGTTGFRTVRDNERVNFPLLYPRENAHYGGLECLAAVNNDVSMTTTFSITRN